MGMGQWTNGKLPVSAQAASNLDYCSAERDRPELPEDRSPQSDGFGSALANLESQRNCVLQPMVAIRELPWVSGGAIFNLD